MKGLHWGWYLVVGFVALAPVGARVLTWSKYRPEPVDPEMAQAGQTLFAHVWTKDDPLSAGGDGLGPVYNANSCVACHNQGGTGGAGKNEHNVTTFVVREMTPGCRTGQREVVREGVIHSQALDGYQETMKQAHPDLPAVKPSPALIVPEAGMDRSRIPMPSGVHLSQRNTPALFGANLIDAIPDRVIIANERKEQLKLGLAPKKSEDLPVGRACGCLTVASDTSAGRRKAPACRRSCRPPARTS